MRERLAAPRVKGHSVRVERNGRTKLNRQAVLRLRRFASTFNANAVSIQIPTRASAAARGHSCVTMLPLIFILSAIRPRISVATSRDVNGPARTRHHDPFAPFTLST